MLCLYYAMVLLNEINDGRQYRKTCGAPAWHVALPGGPIMWRRQRQTDRQTEWQSESHARNSGCVCSRRAVRYALFIDKSLCSGDHPSNTTISGGFLYLWTWDQNNWVNGVILIPDYKPIYMLSLRWYITMVDCNRLTWNETTIYYR